MDLVFAQLLPLFVYPLGLACVLLGVAIVCFWKRPRWAAIAMVLSLSLLLIGSNYWVSRWLLQTLETQNLPGSLPNAAAIVVLGGAIKGADPPRPWIEVAEAGDRLLYAAKLYRDGKAPLVILSGGRISWLSTATAAPESADMAILIETMGVPASALLQDSTSLNTYQNAVNVQKILKEKNITGSILLVTSAFHMPRALAIFNRLGIPAIAAPTDFHTTQTAELSGAIGFLLSLLPSAETLQNTTLALKEYVGLVVYRLRGWL
uniref:DUF218 domain-containing protein n=1 Tax=Cyanothece sp. (strain PCC 7425 / ATCC 29141) TaxID=395961 RepID=B8HLC9_CYAP4